MPGRLTNEQILDQLFGDDPTQTIRPHHTGTEGGDTLPLTTPLNDTTRALAIDLAQDMLREPNMNRIVRDQMARVAAGDITFTSTEHMLAHLFMVRFAYATEDLEQHLTNMWSIGNRETLGNAISGPQSNRPRCRSCGDRVHIDVVCDYCSRDRDRFPH